MALAPERRRRKLELLYERLSALREKKIDIQDNGVLKAIDEEIAKLNVVNSIVKEPLYIDGTKKLSLNTYNIILLSYVVFLFAASLIFMVLLAFNYIIVMEWLVILFSGMTIIAFGLIIPASYWSMIRDYDLGLSK